MKRLFAALAMVVAAISLAGVSSASAATVFGSGCTATQITDGAIWVSTGHGTTSPLPVTAPIPGVITEWTVNTDIVVEQEGKLAGEFPRILQQRLLVLAAEGPESFKVVGEAAGGPLNLKGSNTYTARIPVQAGDFLGLAGNPFTAWCDTKDPADTYAAATGGTPPGSVFRVERATGHQIPVAARVEPDVDGDGYGDETQDQCPQSAAYQTACPVVTVSSLSLTHPKSVTVYVSSSLVAPIVVSAKVKVGKGKTASLKARPQTVAPGALGRFNLVLTKKVLNTLKALTTKKSLTLKISASATNVTGLPSIATSKLKLRGERRPLHRRKAHRKKPQNPAKTRAPKHKHQ
jgi:hypothetical protein